MIYLIFLLMKGIIMKNYYEILEVSETASSEVIEQAYKTLAKKIVLC